MVIMSGFGDARLRSEIMKNSSCRTARESMISLSPATFGRLLNMMGYDAQPLGRRYRGSEDGRAYRPFRMRCDATVNSVLGAAHLSPMNGGDRSRELLSIIARVAA